MQLPRKSLKGVVTRRWSFLGWSLLGWCLLGVSSCDEDLDGYAIGTDCDDQDPSTYPGALELCDGKDNNCDGVVDEGLSTVALYPDLDGDQYGDPNQLAFFCEMQPGYTTDGSDCNDSDPSIHPGAVETLDGRDQDCDGVADNGVATCGDGFVNGYEECDITAGDVTAGEACEGACSGLCACPQTPFAARLELNVYDVGDGDAMLLTSPEGFTLLIDAGSAQASERLIERLHGISLDYILATHMAEDHVGGVPAVLEAHPEVVACLDHGDPHGSAAAAAYSQACEGRRHRLEAGDSLEFGALVRVEVLHAYDGHGDDEEQLNSIVLRVTHGQRRFLLGGDCLSSGCEDGLLQADLRADVLKVHNHGAATASSSEFLSKVRPRIALISAEGPKGEPEESALERLSDTGAEVLTTYLSSDLQVYTDGESLFALPSLGYSQVFSRPPVDMDAWATADYPLGAQFDGSDITFAIYSRNAERILLEVYSTASGSMPTSSYWLAKGEDQIWRARIEAGEESSLYYGLRAWGPNWPYHPEWQRLNSAAGFISDVDASGNRFNPNKVLSDPYARELSHDKSNPDVLGDQDAGMYASGDSDYRGVVRREFDTGQWAPKSVLFEVSSYDRPARPQIPQQDAIILEEHVRGATQHASASDLKTYVNGIPRMDGVDNIDPELRGTYAGLAKLAPFYKGLGVNTIELMPIHETDNDGNPSNASNGNFWGYMPFSYFAPDRRYSYDKSPGGPTREFKQMVDALHRAGIEVYLDVVYNHTGEGGIWSAEGCDTADLLSYRGLDNSEYYALVPNNPCYYWETTGCGNNFDASSDVVKRLIKDSLRYAIEELGVDGFRFDIAVVLGRDNPTTYAFNPQAQLLKDIAHIGFGEYPFDVEMIAEPWDISTYGQGQFPSGWAEWNGKYRDNLRRAILGQGNSSALGYSQYGSYDDFADQGGPQKSVNFITCHDGFVMMDLVSYDSKMNDRPFPFGPSSGGADSNDSFSWWGDKSLRRAQMRNFVTLNTMARGVPMILYGDPLARTQNGNNNAYNLDSIATYSNYEMLAADCPNQVDTGYQGSAYDDNYGCDTANDGLNGHFLFVQNMLALRQAHPTLRQSSYAVPHSFTVCGCDSSIACENDSGSSSSLPGMRIHIDGSAASDHDFVVLINMCGADKSFGLPTPDSGQAWFRRVDTQPYFESQGNFWGANPPQMSSSYVVKARSVVVLESM